MSRREFQFHFKQLKRRYSKGITTFDEYIEQKALLKKQYPIKKKSKYISVYKKSEDMI